MGELYNPFPKLPKNIRQIGDRDDVVKLYVEDYVNTYLKRLYPAGGQDLRVGLLLGNVENHDGTPYIFIDGALEMEDVSVSGEKVIFSETAWKKAYQSIEETFPKRTVQGWFLCGAPGCALSPLNYWKQHTQYFGGKNQLMYLNSGIDGDESLYITSDDGFYRLKGYSIYYERNQMMQDYMILRKDAHRVESGTNDRVIRDFRQRMEGRKREAASRNGTIHTLGMLCSALTVAVLAGGVVMFNNYHKMREMESALVSVLPSGVKDWRNYGDGAAGDEKDELIVETVRGKVYPTTADLTDGVEGAGEYKLFSEDEMTGGETGQAQGNSLENAAGALSGENEKVGESGQPDGENQTPGQAMNGGSGLPEGEGQSAYQAMTEITDQSGSASGDGKEAPVKLAEGDDGGNGGSGGGESNSVDGAGESKKKEPLVPASAVPANQNTGQSGQDDREKGDEESAEKSAEKSSEKSAEQGAAQSNEKKDYPVTNMKPGKVYVVGEGETLYGICFKLYGNIRYLEDICALNKLDDEDKIISGQELILPDISES